MPIVLNQNEYITGLVNLVLKVNMYALNTSNRQADILSTFSSEALEFGDQKAFIAASMPDVEEYSQTSSLLKQTPATALEEFLGDPIKRKIPLSRVEPFIKMAMINAEGMGFLVAYLNGLMYSAKDNYLYNDIMKDLFSWTPENTTNKEMRQTVSLFDTAGMTDPQEILAAKTLNQQEIELHWQKIFDDFSIFTDVFLDIDNTKEGTNIQSALKLDDLIFIGNAKYLNEQVVSLMATLLKSDVISKDFRKPPVLKIPQRTCDGNNASTCVGFVAHKKWYQWYYHFMIMGSFYDPDTLMIKNILHFWYSKGKLKTLPVMRLDAVSRTEPSTLTV